MSECFARCMRSCAHVVGRTASTKTELSLLFQQTEPHRRALCQWQLELDFSVMFELELTEARHVRVCFRYGVLCRLGAHQKTTDFRIGCPHFILPCIDRYGATSECRRQQRVNSFCKKGLKTSNGRFFTNSAVIAPLPESCQEVQDHNRI